MPRASLTRDELSRVGLYFELLQRYQHLEAAKMLPLVAVRVLFLRRGYNSVMGGMARWGEDVMVNYAREELIEMARLWAFMVHQDPPPPDKREGVMNSIRMTRDAAADVETTKRIFAFLARCNLREAWMRQRDNEPVRKEH